MRRVGVESDGSGNEIERGRERNLCFKVWLGVSRRRKREHGLVLAD